MSDEDDVWERILQNAQQLSFPEWNLDDLEESSMFPPDKEAKKKRDERWCSCDNRQEVKVMIFNEVVPTCSARLGGCSKEIHPDDWSSKK